MYTSIKVNTGSAANGQAIGIKVPTSLGYIERGKTYTLQFKYIPIENNHNILK